MQALSQQALSRRWQALGTLMRPPQESPLGEDPESPKRLKFHPCRPIPFTRTHPSHPPLQMQADRAVEDLVGSVCRDVLEVGYALDDPKSLEKFHPGHQLKLTNCHQPPL